MIIKTKAITLNELMELKRLDITYSDLTGMVMARFPSLEAQEIVLEYVNGDVSLSDCLRNLSDFEKGLELEEKK
jgi:hypothetical protein